MEKIIRDLLILVLVFGGIVAGFVLLRQQFPDALSFGDEEEEEWSILSEEQEEVLGDFFMDELIDQNVIVSDSFVDSTMEILYTRLLEHSRLDRADISFHVVKDDAINAITLPGGNIVIFTGLIEFCDEPEQLAGVVAHELGHVYHNHVMEKLAREVGVTLILAALTGGDPGLIQQLSASLLSNVFSRGQETEADVYALDLLRDSNIHPWVLGEFFESLNEEDMSFDESLEWLMTHPHNEKRIAMSERYELPRDFEAEPLDVPLDEIMERI